MRAGLCERTDEDCLGALGMTRWRLSRHTWLGKSSVGVWLRMRPDINVIHTVGARVGG